MIRRARQGDLEALTEIYNQAIRAGRCTGDTEIFTPAARQGWLDHNQDPRTPIFVYEQEGVVAGYCYLSAYRPGRKALQGTAEISYYLDFAQHGKGIGSALVAHTIGAARELGYAVLLGILLSCNAASIALLEKFGFVRWGELPGVVNLGGERIGHYYYGLELGQAGR